MELWRPESCGQNEPKVLGAANLCIAVALHVVLFAGFWVFAVFHGLFDKEEEIIPIDLTVVVVERPWWWSRTSTARRTNLRR